MMECPCTPCPATLTRRCLPPHQALAAFEAGARLRRATAAAAELALKQIGVIRPIRVLEEPLGI